jgi:uracil-DNA glycosylase
MHESWRTALLPEFQADYMARLLVFLRDELAAGKQIFPAENQWWRALELTPLDNVRVVILGQDPYHGAGQAHGLCFSVPHGVRAPPSLTNIYKEMQADLGIPRAPHGNLEHWANQGVLMLNSVLTVQAGQAASHQKRGWERFTDAAIRAVNDRTNPAVFLLWGAYAQKKAAFVDSERHLVLNAAHPSPLAAHNGFFGCGHFSKANAFLQRNGIAPIDWALPEADNLFMRHARKVRDDGDGAE